MKGGGSGGGAGGGMERALLEAEEEQQELAAVREQVLAEARRRGAEGDAAREGVVALRLLENAQRELMWVRQEKAALAAQLERARREQVLLQGRLAAGQEEEEAAAQAVLDSSLLSARLGVRDQERAKGVVDLLRTMHSLGTDVLPPSPLQRLQVTEAKRNLNRAVRCLVLENQSAVHTAIWEVLRFLDGHEVADPVGEAPGIQIVFVEGESLIFRMINLRLQPRDVYLLCSLGDDCPRGGWGLKAVLAVSDTPAIFSAPFQLRLDAVGRGPQGVLCPEWVPSVDATTPAGEPIIPPSYRARIKDNCTFVYAPLRPSAQALLRVADMEAFDGLALAFTQRTRSVEVMLVSYEGPAEVKVVRQHLHTADLSPAALPTEVAPEAGPAAAKGVQTLQASVRVAGHRAAECLVRQTATTRIPDRSFVDDGGGPTERRYRVHDFQVSLLPGGAEEGGMDVDQQQTRITLAFPLDADGQALRRDRRRQLFPKAGGRLHTETLFCHNPVARGGKLPFAVNADFDLTGDLGGLHPTSAWNHWLLGCVARLFVLALLRDPLLRDHAEHYMPLTEETPTSGLWSGFVETAEKLLQSFLFVKTESGRLVARAQAVARPPGIGKELISDELLSEATDGRKHFAAAPEPEAAAAAAAAAEEEDGGVLPPCSLELVLRCVARAQASGRLVDDRALAQLWTYLAGALPQQQQEAEAEAGLSDEAATLLREKLALFPVQGQAAPRAFRVEGLPVFLPPTQVPPPHPPLDPFLVPLLDAPRLQRAGLGCDAAALQAALRVVGVREAVPAEVEDMARRLFEPQPATPAVLQDPDRFWALRTLVVETLGAAATLRAFLGDRAVLALPGLEAAATGKAGGGGGGDGREGVAPRVMRVEPGADASERFLLPTFLGVPLGAFGAVLHRTAAWEQPTKSGRKGLLRPPGPVVPPAPTALGDAFPALPWGELVQWEAAMLAEVGVDGGSNRNWQAALELCPPQQLAAAVTAGLRDPRTTPAAHAAFARLLEAYLEQHAQVFEAVRAAHRPPNADLLRLVQDPNYPAAPRGAPLRFTRGFARACLELLAGGGDGEPAAPSLTLDALAGVLPLVPAEEEPAGDEAAGGRFAEAASLAVMRLDSLFAAALALHVLTRRLAERGALVQAAPGAEWRAAEQEQAWGRLLAALFRRAVENLGHAYGAGIRNRKRKRPGGSGSKDLLEEDAGLLQAYCREFGFWLRQGQGGPDGAAAAAATPRCVPLAQAVWSLDDPVARLVEAAAAAGKAEDGEVPASGAKEEEEVVADDEEAAGPPLVALDRELSGVLEAEEEEEGAGGREMVRKFFAEGLGLAGDGRFRQRLLALLRRGLARWAAHKGPMPRDVEQAYRALCEAAAGAAGGKSGGGFGFEEVPVLNLSFEPGALAVGRAGRNGGSGGNGGVVKAEELAARAQQALVAVADAGDAMGLGAEDSTLHWFYRENFPSRCLHTAILALLRVCGAASLLPRLRLAQPRQCFLESYADTTGSVFALMKAMNVDQVKVAKIVAELYAGNPAPASPSPAGPGPASPTAAAVPPAPTQRLLPITEVGRYWAHAKELRDLVLEELWATAADPTAPPRDKEELIEAIKGSLRLPLARRSSALPSAPVEMVNAARAGSGQPGQGPPLYLGSILGIDLELQDRVEELPRLVKHPHVSKEAGWHRNHKPEMGFPLLEQCIYWERFLLAMGVQPLKEEHLALLSREVLNKVFVTLVKFNALLNQPDQTLASKFSTWSSYHFLYQAIDGGRYINKYKGLDGPAGAAAQQQQQQQQQMAAAAAAAASGWDAAAAAAAMPGYPGPLGLPASLSGSGYAAYYAQQHAVPMVPPAPPQQPQPMGAYGYQTAAGTTAGAGAAAPGAAYGAVAAAPSPPPALPMSAGGRPPPPVKRQRESTGGGGAGAAADEASPAPAKAPRLVPPVPPPAPAAPVQEEGEIEEGEIEG